MTQGVLSRDLRMALLVGGQASEEATARFIDHICCHLGETAAGLRFDAGIVADMMPPADLAKITEVPGSMQHDMLILARGLGRQSKVLRRDRSLVYADRSVLRITSSRRQAPPVAGHARSDHARGASRAGLRLRLLEDGQGAEWAEQQGVGQEISFRQAHESRSSSTWTTSRGPVLPCARLDLPLPAP